ncbi:MAG: class I SAM-dependent methyltransferase [Deltaproteobacteria bacterium]|nr:class I SAM-dependent methyltransferase [Deltaproteobacteria bacterium]
MALAKQHYETLLGDVYAWSVASRGDPFARAAAWLARHHLDRAATYLDLGAGFGAHALTLARAGKQVTAVDFDATLLGQLREALTPALQVDVHQGDLVGFLDGAGDRRWDVILCAGDTLTHLPDIAAVRALLAGAARHLAPGGALALEFRDSTGFDAEGVARFIEVARDAHRIMHCLLEPLDADRLRVTDLVTDVGPEGPTTRISDYVKLRLAPARLIAWAAQAGLPGAVQSEDRGMTTLVLRP